MVLFFLGQSSLGFLPRPYWLHLTQCRLSRLLIWLDERMETRMLKYTMLHTTGYQKLLYGKENITPYLKFNTNTCHLWGSQWLSVHFWRVQLSSAILVEILKNNSSKPTLVQRSAVSRRTVYRACPLSTFIIYRPTVGRKSAKCWSW